MFRRICQQLCVNITCLACEEIAMWRVISHLFCLITYVSEIAVLKDIVIRSNDIFLWHESKDINKFDTSKSLIDLLLTLADPCV